MAGDLEDLRDREEPLVVLYYRCRSLPEAQWPCPLHSSGSADVRGWSQTLWVRLCSPPLVPHSPDRIRCNSTCPHADDRQKNIPDVRWQTEALRGSPPNPPC